MFDALQHFNFAFDEHLFAFAFGLVDNFESEPFVRRFVPALINSSEVSIADFVMDVILASDQRRVDRIGLEKVSSISAFCNEFQRPSLELTGRGGGGK